MSKTLKVGIIGCGGIARGAHLNPGWLAVPDVEIIAACDAHEETAKKLAEDFKIKLVFTDFHALLKLKEIDIVDICTPNKIHTPAVIAALQAGQACPLRKAAGRLDRGNHGDEGRAQEN